MKRSISIITVGAALAATLLATSPAAFAKNAPVGTPSQTTVVRADVIDPLDAGDTLDAPDAPGEGLVSGKTPVGMPAPATVVRPDVIDPLDAGDTLDAPDAPDAPGEGLVSGKGL